MRYSVFALMGLALALPATGEPQSLAEAARAERERREERQRDGSSGDVPSYGNEDLPDGDESDADAGEAVPDAAEDAVGDEGDDARRDEGPAATRESARRELLREASDRRDRERRQAEANWRRAAAQARARIDAAKRELAALDELWLVEGERYVDAEGRTVIRDLDHLRDLKQRAERELSDAEKALHDLRTRARREGVPPGWLR